MDYKVGTVTSTKKQSQPSTHNSQLILIDGHSLIYRAFFAIRQLSTSKGFPTNAIYGFTNMLIKVIRDKQPDYLAVAFDSKGPTHRHQEYEAYKEDRPEMPEALQQQLPFIHRVVSGLRIPELMMEGYEADDLIGTVAKQAEREDLKVTIVTGDKDLHQLISPAIEIYDGMKNKVYHEQDVYDRFGVDPSRIVEIMGLMGDSIDNIPGIPGIGEKTATKLIQQFETIENLLDNLEQVKPPKLQEKLQEHTNLARMSRELARLRLDCPIQVSFPDLKRTLPDLQNLSSLFHELEFGALLKRVMELQEKVESDPPVHNTPIKTPSSFQVVNGADSLAAMIKRITQVKIMVIELWPPDPFREWMAIVLSIPDQCFLIPLNPEDPNITGQVKENAVIKKLKPALIDPSIQKLGYNLKPVIKAFLSREIMIKGLSSDLHIASYLLNPIRKDHSFETILQDHNRFPIENLPPLPSPEKVPIEKIGPIFAARGQSIIKLSKCLGDLLTEQNLTSLFEQVEMPLLPVLAGMELAGIQIDTKALKVISKELDGKLPKMIDHIHKITGEKFNINSPKQLQEILFKRLGLKPIKRTKTGFSTNEEVLQQLSLEHELPGEILKYRQLSKLKSTYIDSLPKLVNPQTGRIHTSFNQTATATGRLSSSDPNLQNIPIKGEWGERIRACFIAKDGWRLLSFDYNQIELRILAHLSQDRQLIADFQNDNDIHTSTASKIFGVPTKDVTPQMRRTGKTVNFGIVYGISPYGLSTTLQISQNDAKSYIESYFSHYKEVREFIDRIIQEASTQGYVSTILNRRRSIPELASQDRATHAFGERTAVNTVIQGSAADLIKLAMIRIADQVTERALEVRMLLQIHDELIFEVLEADIEATETLVTREMEESITLEVPLKVDLGIGNSWSEAHS